MKKGVLCSVLVAFLVTQAAAEIRRFGLDGSQEKNIQSIVVAELAEPHREVTITTNSAISSLAGQFGDWCLNSARGHPDSSFLQKVVARYRIAVQRENTSCVLYLVGIPGTRSAVGEPTKPLLWWTLYSLEPDGTYRTYLWGPTCLAQEPEPSALLYVEQLFR